MKQNRNEAQNRAVPDQKWWQPTSNQQEAHQSCSTKSETENEEIEHHIIELQLETGQDENKIDDKGKGIRHLSQ